MPRSRLLAACTALLVAAPAPAADLAPGDVCTVVAKAVPLQRGDELRARIPPGTRLTVQRVRDGWVRVAYPTGGTTHEGWVETGFVVPAPAYDAGKPARVPAAYERLARAVTDPLATDPVRLGTRKPDPAREIADLRDAVADLTAAGAAEPGDLGRLARDGAAELEWCAKLLRAASEHPDAAGLPRPTVWSASAKAGVLPRAEVGVKEIAPDESLPGLAAKLFHSCDEVRALGLRAAALARRTAGPRVTRGQAVAVDFDEALEFEARRFHEAAAAPDPFDPPDRLRVTNAAGAALTHCTVLVEVVGEAETRSNVHYVGTWPAGQTLAAYYYPGLELGQKAVLRTTSAHVKEVRVSVWCDQLSQEGIRYAYTAREKELAFRAYVDRAVVVAGARGTRGCWGTGTGSGSRSGTCRTSRASG